MADNRYQILISKSVDGATRSRRRGKSATSYGLPDCLTYQGSDPGRVNPDPKQAVSDQGSGRRSTSGKLAVSYFDRQYDSKGNRPVS
jgi:hypothetical protein